MRASVPASDDGVNRELARKYDALAYAAQAHPLSHPGHLATVATLLGLDAPDVATCRVLEVGCSDGANLLPMAATLPAARFVGCDLSGHAIAEARRGTQELGLTNITFLECDLATMADDGRVTIVGRAKDLIISGGFNVYPKEIEDEINSIAGVAE